MVELVRPCNCKTRGHKVLAVPPATLEFQPRVSEKGLVACSALSLIIFPTPHFRNPYLTKMANQLGRTLLVTLTNRDTFSIFLELSI
jgi:hypothetical protein